MKWDEMGCIENPNFIPSIHHYIYEMGNEIGNVMNNEMTISLKVLGRQYRSRHPFVGTDCTVFKVTISQKIKHFVQIRRFPAACWELKSKVQASQMYESEKWEFKRRLWKTQMKSKTCKVICATMR